MVLGELGVDGGWRSDTMDRADSMVALGIPEVSVNVETTSHGSFSSIERN